MKIVAGVFPFQNVGDCASRFLRIALRQQVGVLMLVAKKTLGGSIALNERQMADHSETHFTPSSEKFVSFVPAVETDAEAIPSQHAIDFLESRLDPIAVVVIGNEIGRASCRERV